MKSVGENSLQDPLQYVIKTGVSIFHELPISKLYGTIIQLQDFLCSSKALEKAEEHGSKEQYIDDLSNLLDIVSTELFVTPSIPAHTSPVHLHAIVIQLFSILDSLCDYPPLKISFAQKWGRLVFEYLGKARIDEADSSTLHFALPYDTIRACCTLLTNIVKETETHKFVGDIRIIASYTRQTSDIYVQLQCMEIIYCLGLSNPAILRSLADVLGAPFVDSMERLPGDARMLRSMLEIAQTSPNSHVCSIESKSISFSPLPGLGKTSTGPTTKVHKHSDGSQITTFFGKTIMVLDWQEADLAVPYDHIQAIKLNRHKELVIRFAELPFSMRPYYELKSDDATLPSQILFTSNSTDFPSVSLAISDSEYRKMRESNVQQWISKEIARSKALQKSKAISQEARNDITDMDSTQYFTDAEQSLKRKRDENDQSNITLPSHANFLKSTTAPYPNQKVEHTNLPTNAIHTDMPSSTGAFASSALAFTSSAPRPLPSSISTQARRESPKLGKPFVGNIYSTEIDPLLSQLKEIVTQKVSVRHKEGQEILSEAMRRFDTEVQQLQGRCDKHYTEYSQLLKTEMNELRREQSALKASMSSLVDKLSADITGIAAQNNVLAEHMTAMELELQQGLSEVKSHQEEAVGLVQKKVQAELSSLDARIHEMVASMNPLRFMTKFLEKGSQGNRFSARSLFDTPERLK